jgi:hypothetical protein
MNLPDPRQIPMSFLRLLVGRSTRRPARANTNFHMVGNSRSPGLSGLLMLIPMRKRPLLAGTHFIQSNKQRKQINLHVSTSRFWNLHAAGIHRVARRWDFLSTTEENCELSSSIHWCREYKYSHCSALFGVVSWLPPAVCVRKLKPQCTKRNGESLFHFFDCVDWFDSIAKGAKHISFSASVSEYVCE